MPIDSTTAFEQVMRLSGLPYFGQLQPQAIEELVAVLQYSDTEAQAANVISALLADTIRAANPDTNRVPSPGELRIWLHSEQDKRRAYWRSPDPPPFCIRCAGSGRIGDPDFIPDWNKTPEQILADCQSSVIPCPDCLGVIA
jgi:hypothetical protein